MKATTIDLKTARGIQKMAAAGMRTHDIEEVLNISNSTVCRAIRGELACQKEAVAAAAAAAPALAGANVGDLNEKLDMLNAQMEELIGIVDALRRGVLETGKEGA